MTPGLLWQLRPSDVEVELLAHTRNVVSKDLEEETGLHTGWIQNGGLFIASNKQRLDEYKRLMSVRRVVYPRVQRSRVTHKREEICLSRVWTGCLHEAQSTWNDVCDRSVGQIGTSCK